MGREEASRTLRWPGLRTLRRVACRKKKSLRGLDWETAWGQVWDLEEGQQEDRARIPNRSTGGGSTGRACLLSPPTNVPIHCPSIPKGVEPVTTRNMKE